MEGECHTDMEVRGTEKRAAWRAKGKEESDLTGNVPNGGMWMGDAFPWEKE